MLAREMLTYAKYAALSHATQALNSPPEKKFLRVRVYITNDTKKGCPHNEGYPF